MIRVSSGVGGRFNTNSAIVLTDNFLYPNGFLWNQGPWIYPFYDAGFVDNPPILNSRVYGVGFGHAEAALNPLPYGIDLENFYIEGIFQVSGRDNVNGCYIELKYGAYNNPLLMLHFEFPNALSPVPCTLTLASDNNQLDSVNVSTPADNTSFKLGFKRIGNVLYGYFNGALISYGVLTASGEINYKYFSFALDSDQTISPLKMLQFRMAKIDGIP